MVALLSLLLSTTTVGWWSYHDEWQLADKLIIGCRWQVQSVTKVFLRYFIKQYEPHSQRTVIMAHAIISVIV